MSGQTTENTTKPRVWFNGFTWCVATSGEEAQAIVMRDMGIDDEEATHEGWAPVDDDDELTMNCESSRPVKKTAAEWAATETGILGSTDW